MAEQSEARQPFVETNPIGAWMCEVEAEGMKVRVMVIATNGLRARVAARFSDRAGQVLGVAAEAIACREAIYLGPISNISDGQGVFRNRELREWFRQGDAS